ncbi:MAG: PhzF family phenazine biosynthesis protein [Flavobacteriaceae bacterium]
MNKTIYQVDSFTDVPFKGNPAGVMLLETELTEIQMQNIAMEMNLSETAFVIAANDHFKIRFFTPTSEIALCGHATLASAHILYESGKVKPQDAITFKTTETLLHIEKSEDCIQMTLPEYSLEKTTLDCDFQNMLGWVPLETYFSKGWTIAVAETEALIQNTQPDFALMKTHNLESLIITAKSSAEDVDIVARCFVPEVGINEDPVTGSAHCALAPLWAGKLNKRELKSRQLSTRGGLLDLKLGEGVVEITGKAVTIFKATLVI